MNSLVASVDTSYAEYEPTRAARAIQEFTVENLSNWFVRLSRRRFWKSEQGSDQLMAFSTLHHCLETVALLMAPIAPFFADRLFGDLQSGRSSDAPSSVHCADFPQLMKSGSIKSCSGACAVQKITSMILGIRKKERIRVRQPLKKLVVPVLDQNQKAHLESVVGLITSEVNVKELELLEDTSGLIVKRVKPNFRALGPRVGKQMKTLSQAVAQMGQEEIAAYEQQKSFALDLEGTVFELQDGDLEVMADDIPGWLNKARAIRQWHSTYRSTKNSGRKAWPVNW